MAEPMGRGLRAARRSGLTSPEPVTHHTAARPPEAQPLHRTCGQAADQSAAAQTRAKQARRDEARNRRTRHSLGGSRLRRMPAIWRAGSLRSRGRPGGPGLRTAHLRCRFRFLKPMFQTWSISSPRRRLSCLSWVSTSSGRHLALSALPRGSRRTATCVVADLHPLPEERRHHCHCQGNRWRVHCAPGFTSPASLDGRLAQLQGSL